VANQVYANNMEVSCKSASGKSICAFPDTCFTPPTTPATPPGVPIPYPNTGFASDCTDGSSSVKVSNQEVMLKNKSYFKKSTGDEAGSAPKKGLITSKNMGKVYFTAWSMDVKIEGENVVRHLDMTTHNHASTPPNSLVTVYQDMLAALPPECATMKTTFETECASAEVKGKTVDKCTDACKAAQKCILVPKKNDKSYCCGKNTDTEHRTGDHLVEVSSFTQPSGRKGLSGMKITRKVLKRLKKRGTGVKLESALSEAIPLDTQFEKYDQEEAPTVCVGRDHSDPTHHRLQELRDQAKRTRMRQRWNAPLDSWGPNPRKDYSYSTLQESIDDGAKAHKKVFPQCDEECTKKQLEAYHVNEAEIPASTPVRTATVLS
jgi:Toxin PAAR-like domain/GHH signature containing HNH/Endo VII superfamily nuclease toxin  2